MGDALQSLPQARGVWGHARLGNFGFLHSQRSILVHFSRYFLNGDFFVTYCTFG